MSAIIKPDQVWQLPLPRHPLPTHQPGHQSNVSKPDKPFPSLGLTNLYRNSKPFLWSVMVFTNSSRETELTFKQERINLKHKCQITRGRRRAVSTEGAKKVIQTTTRIRAGTRPGTRAGQSWKVISSIPLHFFHGSAIGVHLQQQHNIPGDWGYSLNRTWALKFPSNQE